MKLGIEK